MVPVRYLELCSILAILVVLAPERGGGIAPRTPKGVRGVSPATCKRQHRHLVDEKVLL
jgi:hypothetical protein